MRRLVYLDVLRGVAIVLMVVDHGYDWWLDEAGHLTTLARVAEFMGTLAAPLFLYLVGAGLSLSAWRAEQMGRTRRQVFWRAVRRGGELLLWGYALNLSVFYVGDNPADLFAVDVLQTIGVSIWLSIPLLWMPAPAALAAAAVLGIAGQFSGRLILPDWLAAYLTGSAGIGYFPLYLWLPYVYAGLAVGRVVARTERPGRLMVVHAAVGMVALVLALLADPGWGYRHPRPIFVLFSLAIVSWLMAGAWLWTERRGQVGPVARVLRDMGQASLMVYVLHHLVGYRFFWLLGWVRGRSWRGEYGALRPGAATVLLVCLLILMAASSRLWLGWRARQAQRRS